MKKIFLLTAVFALGLGQAQAQDSLESTASLLNDALVAQELEAMPWEVSGENTLTGTLAPEGLDINQFVQDLRSLSGADASLLSDDDPGMGTFRLTEKDCNGTIVKGMVYVPFIGWRHFEICIPDLSNLGTGDGLFNAVK